MTQARILAFAGSTRTHSFNKKLAAAASRAAEDAGGTVTMVDLRDFNLPLFDEDLEAEGRPTGAVELKRLFLDHNGLLIASPEYNSSVSAVLKNAIDWVSRSDPGEPMKAAFLGKVAAIMSASPGALGGLRGLVHLRAILENISVMVLPDQYALGKAHEAFGDDGTLSDEKSANAVSDIAKKLVMTISKLNA